MADALRRWVLGAAEQQLQQLVATCEPMEEVPGDVVAINRFLPGLSKVKRLQLVQFTSVPTPETPQTTAKLVVSDKQSTLNAILTSDCVKSLTKDGRSLTRMRGGIALANKYKFQFYEHKGELFIHMEIESMTFKGSEGSAMFGDPVELNSHAAIKELLSSVKQSMQGSSFSFSDADDDAMDLLLDEVQVLEDEANNMHRASLSNGSWKDEAFSYFNFFIPSDQKIKMDGIAPVPLHIPRKQEKKYVQMTPEETVIDMMNDAEPVTPQLVTLSSQIPDGSINATPDFELLEDSDAEEEQVSEKPTAPEIMMTQAFLPSSSQVVDAPVYQTQAPGFSKSQSQGDDSALGQLPSEGIPMMTQAVSQVELDSEMPASELTKENSEPHSAHDLESLAPLASQKRLTQVEEIEDDEEDAVSWPDTPPRHLREEAVVTHHHVIESHDQIEEDIGQGQCETSFDAYSCDETAVTLSTHAEETAPKEVIGAEGDSDGAESVFTVALEEQAIDIVLQAIQDAADQVEVLLPKEATQVFATEPNSVNVMVPVEDPLPPPESVKLTPSTPSSTYPVMRSPFSSSVVSGVRSIASSVARLFTSPFIRRASLLPLDSAFLPPSSQPNALPSTQGRTLFRSTGINEGVSSPMAFGASKLDEEHHEEPQQEVDNQGEEARVFDPRSTQYQFSPNPTARSNRLPSQQPVGLILDDASDMMDVVLDDMDASEHNKHSVVRRVHPETDLTDSEVCHDDVRWTRSDACAPTSNLGHFSTPRSSKKNKFSISIADAGEEDTFDALFPEESEVCVAQEEEEEDPHGMTGQPSQPLVSNAVANGKKRGHTDYSLIVEDSQGETEEEAEVLQLSSDDEAEKDDAVPQVASILPAPVRAPYAIQFIPKKRRFSGKFGCSPPPKPIIVPERIPAPAPAPQPAVRSAASTAPKARSRPIRPFSFRPSKPCAPSASTNPRPRMGRPPKKRRLPASFQQQQQQGTSSSGNARPKSRPFVIVEGVKAFL